MKREVWKDKDGAVINIGPWDYMAHDETYTETIGVEVKKLIKLPNGEYMVDGSGAKVTKTVIEDQDVQKTRTVIMNPLPDGAYKDEADIVIGPDGGLYVKPKDDTSSLPIAKQGKVTTVLL